MKRIAAWCICGTAVLLPWRARILFAEALGWTMQAVYGAYVFLLMTMVKALAKKQ